MKKPRRKPGYHASILLAITVALFSCENSTSPPAEPSAEVRALHESRIATHRQLVSVIEAQFEGGDAAISNVLEAQRGLLVARLEATSNAAERVTLREELLENLKQFELQVEAQVKNGGAQSSNLLEVRAARIKAEIDLAEEQE